MKKKIEVLAPVGNIEMLEVAIANGADAVYLGLENFNARAKADNFDSSNIRKYIELCHLFGIKVYITVNTLIANEEMLGVIEMVERAHAAMADAFIVQDIGLIGLIRQTYPNAVIHASTQMGVCNAYGAEVLKKLGVSRVVVARETTLKDIKEIKKTGLEVEVFVQGALCVCYSGSCYMSSLLKNKSGNRGECLQLCRLPYKLVQNGTIKKSGYLLSTRDISLLSRINDLIDAGVDSLKIEGRLRRPAYLAQAIQSVKEVLRNNHSADVEEYKLKKVFSRGDFNKGIYLDSKTNGNIINSEINNHLGVKIGDVSGVKPFKDIYEILINSAHEIIEGDGLKFWDGKKEKSLGVGSAKCVGKNRYVVYSKVCPNLKSEVFLTVDSLNEGQLLKATRKLPILVRVTAIPNNPLTIEFKFGNVEVCVQGCLVEQAKNAPLSESQIADSVSKLGDTYFVADGVVVQTFDAFVPKSAINELRRIAATQLYIAIVNEYETKNCKNFIKNKQNKLKNIHINNKFNYYIIEKISDIERVGDKDAIIVYAPEIYSIENVKCVKTMVEKQFNTKLFLYLPVIANHEDLKLLGEIIRSFPCEQIGLVAGSLYGLYFLDCGYEVVCGTNINISNNYTIRTLQELGACNFVQSIEENLFKVIDGAHKYIGSPCVMTLAMCPFIEHCNSKCNNCKYVPNTELIMDNNAQFIIRRQKISNCYFDLVWKSKKIYPEGTGYMIDLRD